VYGDVFGFEHLLEPLWVRPLEAPLAVLAVPIVGGALVLSIGVLLHAVQTCWRGEGRLPWLADTAQLLVYWGLILTLADARFGWAVAAGVVLCAANRLWAQRSPAALAGGLGQLAESTFELLLNTLSFARVGAFALAHAALEFAVISTAAAVQSPWIAGTIVVLGNILVIVVEGVVVSIQTTRLVLFEFFIRFFEGTGRLFTPAASPPSGGGRRER
jgi:V/A-type H+-transporting ATPase subunit I